LSKFTKVIQSWSFQIHSYRGGRGAASTKTQKGVGVATITSDGVSSAWALLAQKR